MLAACFLGNSVEEVVRSVVVFPSANVVEVTADVVAGVLLASICPLAPWLTEGSTAV